MDRLPCAGLAGFPLAFSRRRSCINCRSLTTTSTIKSCHILESSARFLKYTRTLSLYNPIWLGGVAPAPSALVSSLYLRLTRFPSLEPRGRRTAKLVGESLVAPRRFQLCHRGEVVHRNALKTTFELELSRVVFTLFELSND